jgi:ABC-type uncharacterized transport system ATPase subunit
VATIFRILYYFARDLVGQARPGAQALVTALLVFIIAVLLPRGIVGTVSDLFQTVKRLKEEMSVLLVEQNVAAALEISDCVYVIENGRIVLQGKPEELAANEHVKKAYLGV